jgi:LysR family transcriptional regulator, low CO2-responsive transcriptional regulator
MKNATLRQLKVFEAVARNLSFARAAEELYLTPPAVSIQVKKLEEHVGLPLFEQLGKKIYLTDAGDEMLRSSRSIIQQFLEAEEAITHLKGGSGGRLRVSVISAGDYFFPQLLVEFLRSHAGAKLDFGVFNREELLERMDNNQTDLAVVVRPPAHADFIAEAFAPHPYVIVAARTHPLVGATRIPITRLLREPFVVREKGSDTFHSMEEAFGNHIGKVNIAMEIRSTETIKQAVMAGMGLSFLSAHTISQELKSQNLAVLDVQGFPLRLNWYLVHRKNKRLPPIATAFKAFLMAQGAGLIDRVMLAQPQGANRSAKRSNKVKP